MKISIEDGDLIYIYLADPKSSLFSTFIKFNSIVKQFENIYIYIMLKLHS